MIRPPLLALLLALGSPVLAAALPKPAALAVDRRGPRFSWQAVPGATLYRVAVFDAPNVEGKRLLLAAVWVAGDHWVYGRGPVVARAHGLASTRPRPLPAGHKLRVMVAAAGAGATRSDWAGADFVGMATAARTPVAVATVTPGPTVAPTRTPNPGADATLEVGGGGEFKSFPDPAVIEPRNAGSWSSAATGVSPAAGSLAAAQALGRAGQASQAEAAFRAVLARDPRNADAWQGLGDSYLQRKMKVEAADAYRKALAIDGSRKRLKDWLEQNVRP